MTEPIDPTSAPDATPARSRLASGPWSELGEHVLSLMLVGGSVIALATCARGTEPPLPQAPPLVSRTPTNEPALDETSSSPPALPERSPEQPPPVVEASNPLGPFWQELEALRAGQRKQPVRVLWLGDSHTAADFMTDVVRRALQERYGKGGPGFVRVGVPHYRHGRVRIELGGKWRRMPQQPSRRTSVLDGVFGPCGMRSVPEPRAFATLRLHGEGDAERSVRWTLLVRLPAQSGLSIGVGGKTERLSADSSPDTLTLGELTSVEGSSIQRYVLTARARDEVRIEHSSGAPEVFGAYVEGESPGVVLDTCGVDGARIATVLAWDAATWQAEVRARAPDLVVLAYGTNEAFDDGSVGRYAGEYARVMERLRAAVPDVPCWIVGPPDAWDRAERATVRVVEITELQRQVASELGCGFVSARDIMGGDGGFLAWRQASPPLASADGVHLSKEGYEKLGAELARLLLPPDPGGTTAREH